MLVSHVISIIKDLSQYIWLCIFLVANQQGPLDVCMEHYMFIHSGLFLKNKISNVFHNLQPAREAQCFSDNRDVQCLLLLSCLVRLHDSISEEGFHYLVFDL